MRSIMRLRVTGSQPLPSQTNSSQCMTYNESPREYSSNIVTVAD